MAYWDPSGRLKPVGIKMGIKLSRELSPESNQSTSSCDDVLRQIAKRYPEPISCSIHDKPDH